MMAREQAKAKVLLRNSMGNCRNSGTYGHRAETCWATGSTKPTEKCQGGKKGKQVNVLDEQVRTPAKRYRNTVERCVYGKLQRDV